MLLTVQTKIPTYSSWLLLRSCFNLRKFPSVSLGCSPVRVSNKQESGQILGSKHKKEKKGPREDSQTHCLAHGFSSVV